MRFSSVQFGIRASVAALLLHVACMAPALAADEAGVVIVVSGPFVADRADGTQHTLQRRSTFYVGDTLRLDEIGRAQIRFHDGTILSLAGGTDLKVDAFRWSENEPADKVANIVSLLKGGFRTITGAVAKRNREAYQVNTPVATIGVRGTHFSLALVDSLYVGVSQGAVTLANDSGSLDLGLDASYRYAQVSPDQSMQGLMEAPTVLLEIMDSTPVEVNPAATDEGTSTEQADSDEKPADTETKTTEAGATTTAEDGATAEDHAAADDTGTAAATPTNDDSSSKLASEHVAEADASLTSLTTDTFIDGTKTSLTTITTEPLTPIVKPTLLETPTDARLSEAELQSLTKVGFIALAGLGLNGAYGGKASEGSAGDPIFVDNGLYPGAAEFDTRTPDVVVRRGGATTNWMTSQPDLGAVLGEWAATPTDPIVILTDATDASVATSYPGIAFWMTFDSTPLSTLQTLSGQIQYANVLDLRFGSNSGPITDFFITVDVDFSNGEVGGGLSAYTLNGDVWQVDFDGTIQGAGLDLAIDTADSVVSTASDGKLGVKGDIRIAFAGSNGDALAGHLDFESANPGPTTGTLRDIDGIFLINNTPVGDRRLTVSDNASIDRLGFAAVSGPVGGVFDGKASAAGTAGTPLLVSNELDIDGDHPSAVVRHGTALVSAPTQMSFGTKQVEWGEWNADLTNHAHKFISASDPLMKELIMDKMIWLTVEPTDAGVLTALAGANKTGTWSGTLAPSNFIGSSGAGTPIANLSFDATIQFNTGAITGAALSADATPATWNVTFNDSVLSGGLVSLTVNEANSTISGMTLADPSVTGGLRGTLTGDTGDTIAATFSLRSKQTDTINLNGAFVSTGSIAP